MTRPTQQAKRRKARTISDNTTLAEALGRFLEQRPRLWQSCVTLGGEQIEVLMIELPKPRKSK